MSDSPKLPASPMSELRHGEAEQPARTWHRWARRIGYGLTAAYPLGVLTVASCHQSLYATPLGQLLIQDVALFIALPGPSLILGLLALRTAAVEAGRGPASTALARVAACALIMAYACPTVKIGAATPVLWPAVPGTIAALLFLVTPSRRASAVARCLGAAMAIASGVSAIAFASLLGSAFIPLSWWYAGMWAATVLIPTLGAVAVFWLICTEPQGGGSDG
ncbi:MAG TPA: hypothetical protein QGH10_15030 [Armatimonadota bacterium]|nr:hypothetical protein [Armatimonadota bacterium]